jgi:cytoskeletal protein CcmA (bactofilin family)
MSEEKQDSVDASSAPAPEVLSVQGEEPTASASAPAPADQKPKSSLRRTTYRPSHKATFIGLAVVAGVLAINGAVISWLVNAQQAGGVGQNNDSVTLSADTLNNLGVSRNPVGNLGAVLTIGPDSTFNGKVTMGSDLTIGGKLQIRGDFTANSAVFTKLQAGEVGLEKLNVNGDGTITSLNLRKDLTVAGNSTFQSTVTMAQLLTVNNNLTVAGNVAVGGVLSARNFQANSLTSGSTLTVGGHIITAGTAPNVGRGAGTGNNGTVSISGNDASGTVAVNAGTGAGNGLLAQISFKSQYGNIPHVVITPVGQHADVYVTRTIGGFSIYASSAMSPGGYAFDYIIMQ